MRVIVVSLHRSCSTFISRLAANKFNLTNYGEAYMYNTKGSQNPTPEANENNWVLKIMGPNLVGESFDHSTYNWGNIDKIIFATRDSDFLPALIKAKKRGKETIAMMAEEMSAAALKNTADKVVFLKGKKLEEKK